MSHDHEPTVVALMSLIEIIAGIEAREATLTVFDTDPAVAEALADHFADRNLAIVDERTTHGPSGYAVLERDGEFVTAVSTGELLPSSNERADGDRVGEPILDRLEETLFTSYAHADMVAASREIEDRAWRVGDGELHAGFQTLDVLTGEDHIYDALGGEANLDVHAYAAAEGDPPSADRYAVHIGETAEIRETWFVAYDGGGLDTAKCVLLAEEREPGGFYGFWSYDPETVDDVIDYLTERYGESTPPDDAKV